MIKWGRRKKQQPPSSPRPSLLSSWLGRLKKMGGATANAAAHHNDVVFAGKHNNPTPPPPLPVIKAACCRSRSTNHHNEELYGGDEDFWRLSFRKEKMYSGYETEEEEEEEEDEKREAFTEMVSGIRRMKELQKITTTEKLKEREFKNATPRRKVVIKSGDERRSVYVNRGSPKRRGKKQGISCRARVVSPRVSSSSSKKKERLERFAVVKCSLDPERDFRESMVEMILERNICGAQQLEDLLACYLALNSDKYHHLIIKVFRQIWFDLKV